MDAYGSNLWDYSNQYVKSFYVAWRKVIRRIWYLPYNTHCNILPFINNTDSVELSLEKRCVKFVWSCLNSSNAVVKNISMFVLDNRHSVLGNNFKYFSYKYDLYRSHWFNKLMTLMKHITVVHSDSALRYGHFVRDLCSIRDYSSTCILTSTELSFLIEYICTI